MGALIESPAYQTPSGYTVIRTNLNTNPSMETAGSVVTVRTNLGINPNAVGASGFSANNGTTHAVTKNVAITGHPAGITTAARSQLQAGQTSAAAMSMYNIDGLINTGPVRKIGAWVYVSASGYQARIGSTSPVVWTPLTASTWTWLTGDIPASSNSLAYIQKVTGNAAEADISYITGVTALANEVPKEAIWGARTAAGDFTYSWSGTANASTSLQRGTSVTPYVTVSSTFAQGVQSTEWASSGTKSLRIIPASTTSASAAVYLTNVNLGLVQGKTYTAIAKLRLAAPISPTPSAAAFPLRLSFYENTGAIWTHGNEAPNVAGVHEVRVTFTYTTGGVGTLRMNHGGAAGSGDVWFDDLAVVEGVYTGSYFDGTTAAPDFWHYHAWTGTANASTSRLYAKTFTDVPRTEPLLVLGFQSSWSTNTVIHNLLDSSEPHVTLRPSGLRRGDLTLLFDDEGKAHDAVRMFRQLDRFEYSDTDSAYQAMTFVVADGDITLELSEETLEHWFVTVPYVEVL